MNNSHILIFCVLLSIIQGEKVLAESPVLEPVFLTQQNSNLKITDIEPSPLGLVQLIGHKYKNPKERYFSGLNLASTKIPSEQLESAISLLGDNRILGFGFNDEERYSMAISSLTDPKIVSVLEISPQALKNPDPAKSIKFDKFVPVSAIFLNQIVAFAGQYGLESIVRFIKLDLSDDSQITIQSQNIKLDNTQVEGFNQIYKFDGQSLLVVASLHSTDKNILGGKSALLVLNSQGMLEKEHVFTSLTYDVFTNNHTVALASIIGQMGSFELKVDVLDRDLNVNKSKSILINHDFPAQYKFIDGGKRPLLAVLGLESVEVFNGESGEKLLTFKTQHEITDIIRFLIVDGKSLLFVNLRSEKGGAPRGAYFELPSNNLF